MAVDDIHDLLKDEDEMKEDEITYITPLDIKGKKTYYYTPTPEESRPKKKYTVRPADIDEELTKGFEKKVKVVKKKVKRKKRVKKIKRKKVIKKRRTKKAKAKKSRK